MCSQSPAPYRAYITGAEARARTLASASHSPHDRFPAPLSFSPAHEFPLRELSEVTVAVHCAQKAGSIPALYRKANPLPNIAASPLVTCLDEFVLNGAATCAGAACAESATSLHSPCLASPGNG
ncbi:hypothetical protein MSG28_002418 [Choristoneura fumiferana]|uniref:Uncharacterized protein n=1 Tax=Choristoneura fumiferana TaxID=7141 RepID=A0ACC0JW97_CHOFU|nr:hypothetical protein MSG28_002418 [Choristoneura fumiferana]